MAVINILSFECWFLPMVAYALDGFLRLAYRWLLLRLAYRWGFLRCCFDELLRLVGVRLVEMCCDSCEVAPRGLTGRRQRCGLDEKRSERPTSCMDHRGSRHRRVDFVALVCYRTLGRFYARRQLLLVAQGHIVACCRLEDLRTAAVRELRTDRPRRRLGDTRALQPIERAARRRRA